MERDYHCDRKRVSMAINHRGEFEFWRAEGYHSYISKHGEHLSHKFGEYASHCLENYDGTDHYWTREEVVKAIHAAKMEIPACMTQGDVHYLANKTYAKYMGGYLKTEAEVLELFFYKLKIKARKGDMSFLKLMTHFMSKGHSVNFCELK